MSNTLTFAATSSGVIPSKFLNLENGLIGDPYRIHLTLFPNALEAFSTETTLSHIKQLSGDPNSRILTRQTKLNNVARTLHHQSNSFNSTVKSIEFAMFCDNCLLVLPLRHGAMALYALVLAYSVAGSIYLFQYGQFHFFIYPDYQLWGGFGMLVGAVCLICLVAFSTNSYMLTRLTFFLWPLVLILTGVRAAVILWELNHNQSNFSWECNNGRLQYTTDNYQLSLNGTLDSSSDNDDDRMPAIFCNQGWSAVYTAFALALVIDFVLQLYGYFLNWRFKARIEHRYRQVAKHEGLYNI